MADSRRGRKTNQVKNAGSARDFAAGKKIGRKRQVWVWDELPLEAFDPKGIIPSVRFTTGVGHWEVVKRATI